MTDHDRRPAGRDAKTPGAPARRVWSAPRLKVIEVAEATEAGAPGITDSGIFS